jgi:hypothetical protein
MALELHKSVAGCVEMSRWVPSLARLCSLFVRFPRTYVRG